VPEGQYDPFDVMKYFLLLWSGIFRKRGRTVLTLLQIWTR
jgi:hypothetical protein